MQGTKRRESFRIPEYFNEAKARIRPFKSSSNLSALLTVRAQPLPRWKKVRNGANTPEGFFRYCKRIIGSKSILPNPRGDDSCQPKAFMNAKTDFGLKI